MRDCLGVTMTKLRAIVSGDVGATEKTQAAMDLIQERHDTYDWIGVYILRDGALHLGPYAGEPTDHSMIEVGRGVCGTAVADNQNQIVYDVRELSNYIACSPDVRSEIVVLIRDGEEILGQIDVDSNELGAFGEEDEFFLMELADLLSPLVDEL
jgi:GAF domain-containing protein